MPSPTDDGAAPMPAKVAVLLLTARCNMHCDFCGAEAGFNPMPFGQATALIDRLAADGLQSVVLGGGEPFLWPQDLVALARHARSKGLLAQVGTNGSLAPEGEAILSEFDRWILPLESVDSQVHDAMRHLEGGHLDKVLHLLDRLRARGTEVTISSLVSQENFDRLLEVGEFLGWYERHGGRVHAWHLYRFLPVGRGGHDQAGRFATGSGIFESLGDLIKQRFKPLRIYLRPDMYHSKETSFHWWERGALRSFEATGAAR